MKSITLLKTTLGLGVVAICLTSATMRSSGSPEAKTGSPLDGLSCTMCHSDNSVITSETLITSDIPQSGYVPGSTYTITVSTPSTSSTKYGFELTAETSANKVGTWTVTENNTKLISDNSAVTHNDAGDYASWTAQWTAPAENTGSVSFYAAVNSTNSNSSNSGDQIYTNNISVSEGVVQGINPELEALLSVYPNPSTDVVNVEGVNVISIDVLDLNGKVVRTSSSSDVDVQGLAKGLYSLKIEAAEGVVTSTVEVK